MKLPPLQSLRTFEAVARTCSMTRAAEELCVSLSAVSHQIHKLEQWLGLPLVERSGRGIRLTEAGERYKVKISDVFDTIHTETELLRHQQASPVVRVTCLPMFAVSWLMPQMHDFWAKHPEIQVAIQYSRMANAVDPATVDVAVRHGDPGEFPDFVAMPFLEAVTFPYASPDYLKRVGYKDESDIRRLTLLHDGQRRTWRTWLERAARKGHGFDPALAKAGRVYPGGHLVLGACLSGEGVALLPRAALLFQLRAKVLVPLSNLGVLEDKSYLLLTPKARSLPRSALLFAQWMQSLPGALKLGVPRG